MTNPPSPENAGPPANPVRHSIVRWLLKAVGILILAFVLVCLLGWATLAVYYSGLHGLPPRTFAAWALVIAALAALLLIRPRRFGVLACFGLFALVVGWFFSLQPSNDRDWAVDVGQIPSVTIDGDIMTVHNVRNFDYRTETDFTPHWEDRTYDLSKLRTVDMFLSFWGPKAIAHTMVSFGFDGDQYLAASIEARRDKLQTYSAVQSFFRQFELIYIFADERDVIRLRTNYRHEDVYLYRTTLEPAQARELLMSYVENANDLNHQPQFYNALTSNCATNVLENAKEGHIHTQMSWRILLNGYAPEQLYRNHRIDTDMPLEEVTAKSYIDPAANQADQDPDFSRLIRVSVPKPAPRPPDGAAQN